MNTGGVVSLVIFLILLVVGLAVLGWWFWRKRMKKRKRLFEESKVEWDGQRDEIIRNNIRKSPAPSPPSPVNMRPHRHTALAVEQEIDSNGKVHVATVGGAYDEDEVIRRLRAMGWTDDDLIKAGKWRPMSSKEFDDVIEELEARQRLSTNWSIIEEDNKNKKPVRTMDQVVKSVEQKMPDYSFNIGRRNSTGSTTSSSSSSDLGMERVQVKDNYIGMKEVQQQVKKHSSSSSSRSVSGDESKRIAEVPIVMAVVNEVDKEQRRISSSSNSSSQASGELPIFHAAKMKRAPPSSKEDLEVTVKVSEMVKQERKESTSSASTISSSDESEHSTVDNRPIMAAAAAVTAAKFEDRLSDSSGDSSDDEASSVDYAQVHHGANDRIIKDRHSSSSSTSSSVPSSPTYAEIPEEKTAVVAAPRAHVEVVHKKKVETASASSSGEDSSSSYDSDSDSSSSYTGSDGSATTDSSSEEE